MDRVFFQGALAQSAVLEALFGAAPATEPAQVTGWRLAGGKVPVAGLVPEAGAQIAGLALVPDEAQSLRLNDFAAVAGLKPQPLGAAGRAYIPQAGSEAPWNPGAAPGWEAILAQALSELAGYLQAGLTPDVLVARWPQMLMRGMSRARALAGPPKPVFSGLTGADVTVSKLRRPYSHYFTVDEIHYSHKRFDGGIEPPVERAVFMAADAVTVLPYDPVRDRVLVVEQIRAGAIARQDPSPWVLEPVAGRIEPGDSPEETAHKETREEAGLSLRALVPVADFYPSAGCFSEYLISFIGLTDLPDAAAGLGGVAAEGEDIRGHIMTREALLARIDRNEIPHGPLMLSALWLDRHLARVRAAVEPGPGGA